MSKKLTQMLRETLNHVMDAGDAGVTALAMSGATGKGIHGVRCALNRLRVLGLIERSNVDTNPHAEQTIWVVTSRAQGALQDGPAVEEEQLPADKSVTWLGVGQWARPTEWHPRSVFELGGRHA
jgi:hypothetical protein